jgi:hypothetical protein
MIKGQSHELLEIVLSLATVFWIRNGGGFDTEPDLDPALFSSGLQYANK